MTEQAEIIAERQRDFPLWQRWRFVAVDRHGDRIAESPMFRSGMFGLLHGKPEHQILGDLLYQLQLNGWQVGRRGQNWYELRLVRTDGINTPTLPSIVGQGGVEVERPGLSPQMMWGISIAVVVFLFLVCVVLVLSAEITIRPGN